MFELVHMPVWVLVPTEARSRNSARVDDTLSHGVISISSGDIGVDKKKTEKALWVPYRLIP